MQSLPNNISVGNSLRCTSESALTIDLRGVLMTVLPLLLFPRVHSRIRATHLDVVSTHPA